MTDTIDLKTAKLQEWHAALEAVAILAGLALL